MTATTTAPATQSAIAKFLDSNLNKAGLATWAGTVITGLMNLYLTHTMPTEGMIIGAVAGLIAILLPESGVTQAQLAQVVADAVAAEKTKSPAAIETVASDALKIAQQITVQKPGE